MKILIADDDPVSRRVLEGALVRMGHEVVAVSEGRSAIREVLAAGGPTMAILDWMMPEVDGLSVCREIRRRPEPYVYVILLTARDRREDLVAGLDAGADDFLIKPLDIAELRARLRSGERVLAWQARLLETQAALRHQATHDHLTGLWNRPMILDALTREVNRAAHNDAALSVAVADIDLFKQINDTQGHAVGDVVLQTVARRIRSVLRDYDAIGRLGGEEFLLVMPACDRAEGRDIAERARSAITSTRITFATGEVAVTLSLGVSCSTPDARLDAASLVELADAALYRAKASGRNRVEM